MLAMLASMMMFDRLPLATEPTVPSSYLPGASVEEELIWNTGARYLGPYCHVCLRTLSVVMPSLSPLALFVPLMSNTTLEPSFSVMVPTFMWP